jgi:hypothetical protein
MSVTLCTIVLESGWAFLVPASFPMESLKLYDGLTPPVGIIIAPAAKVKYPP